MREEGGWKEDEKIRGESEEGSGGGNREVWEGV